MNRTSPESETSKAATQAWRSRPRGVGGNPCPLLAQTEAMQTPSEKLLDLADTTRAEASNVTPQRIKPFGTIDHHPRSRRPRPLALPAGERRWWDQSGFQGWNDPREHLAGLASLHSEFWFTLHAAQASGLAQSDHVRGLRALVCMLPHQIWSVTPLLSQTDVFRPMHQCPPHIVSVWVHSLFQAINYASPPSVCRLPMTPVAAAARSTTSESSPL